MAANQDKVRENDKKEIDEKARLSKVGQKGKDIAHPLCKVRSERLVSTLNHL